MIFLFLCSSILTSAQKQYDCEQLAIDFAGILKVGESGQIILEVSNQMYTGTLYYYPGFLLLNENGDTLAREEVTYYGIGSNFQTHKLEILTDLNFPFTGYLELHGSYYQNKFCSFPIEISSMDYISTDDLKEERVMVAANFSNKNLIIDFSAISPGAEKLDYYISISNEMGDEVYKTRIDSNISSVTIKDLGGPGLYFITSWDNSEKKLLPLEIIEIEE